MFYDQIQTYRPIDDDEKVDEYIHTLRPTDFLRHVSANVFHQRDTPPSETPYTK